MRGNIVIVCPALIVACGLIVLGLWTWEGASDLALDWGASRPQVAAWAMRSAAVAALAGGQVLLLVLVAGRVYRRGLFDVAMTFTASVVFAIALVSAAACALAAR